MKSRAPDNWKIQNLDIGYPSLFGFNINLIEISIINQDPFEYPFIYLLVNDLTSDFDFNDFDVSFLSVRLEKGKKQSRLKKDDLFNLPDLNLFQLFAQLPALSLKVKELTVDVDDNQYRLAAFQTNNRQGNDLEQIYLKTKLQPNHLISFETEIELTLVNQVDSSDLNVVVNQRKLADLTYQSSGDINQLSMTTDIESLNSEISDLFKWPVNIKTYAKSLSGKIDLDLQQNKQTNQLTSHLNFNGSWILNAQVIPLAFSAKSAQKQFPLVLDVNLKAGITETVSLNAFIDLDEKTKVENINLELNTQMLLEQDNVFFNKNKLFTKISEIELVERKLELKKLNIETSMADFNLNQLDLKKIKLTNKIVNTDILFKADSDKNKHISSKIKGAVKLVGFPDSKMSGNINLSEIKSPARLNAKTNKLEILLADINQKLTQGNIELKFKAEDGKFDNFIYKTLAANLSLKLKVKEITAKGNLLLNESLLTPIELTYNKPRESLSVELANSKLELGLINELLKQLKLAKSIKTTLLAGELSHQASVAFDNKSQSISSKHQIRFSKAKLSVGENILSKVEVIGEVNSNPVISGHAKITAEKIELASGLKISKTSLEFVLSENQQLEINNLVFNVLSAKVSSDNLTILGSELKPALINVKGLSLTELLFFTEVDNIYADGLLDMGIPLASEESKLVVKNATFKSQGKGVIKYNTGSIDKDKNIALKALEDFHYKELDGTLNYDKEGNYKIKLRLLGANPKLYNGYPVDFTINISGQLSGLFKSTFLTGNFEKAILNAVDAESK